jgi:hypothetical protein
MRCLGSLVGAGGGIGPARTEMKGSGNYHPTS